MKGFNTGKLAATLAVVGCFAVGSQVRADSVQTFFGEDFVGGSSSASRPNADQAQNDFLNNLQGVRTEDFESASTGPFSALNVMFGSDTATLNGSQTEVRSGVHSGRFATSGNQYVRASGDGSFTIDFSSPQAAFGFFGTDIGDFKGQLTLTLSNGSDKVLDIPHTIDAENGSVLYFGAIATQAADSFSSVTFANTGSTSDVFGFDDMTIGDIGQVKPPPTPNVPTPAALSAGLAMLGGLLVRRRRGQRS